MDQQVDITQHCWTRR